MGQRRVWDLKDHEVRRFDPQGCKWGTSEMGVALGVRRGFGGGGKVESGVIDLGKWPRRVLSPFNDSKAEGCIETSA